MDEFGESVKQVWKIFEGVGETKHNPGDCEKVTVVFKIIQNKLILEEKRDEY